MSQDEIERVVRKENRVLLVLLAVLVLAAVFKPWLLVWDLGLPLAVVAGMGIRQVVIWVRSLQVTASEPAE
jgi:hypothetical protein